MKLSSEVRAVIKSHWLYNGEASGETEECIVLAIIADPQGRADELLILYDNRTRMRTVPVESLSSWMSSQGTAHCFHRLGDYRRYPQHGGRSYPELSEAPF